MPQNYATGDPSKEMNGHVRWPHPARSRGGPLSTHLWRSEGPLPGKGHFSNISRTGRMRVGDRGADAGAGGL